jgi:two-component system cell cycle sensor histidine kinase/response regulator CckA
VLLVDDDVRVRELVERVLGSSSYQVLATGDGLQALQAEERHEGPVHLLLTDVVLPQVSGQGLAAVAGSTTGDGLIRSRRGFPSSPCLCASLVSWGAVIVEILVSQFHRTR